MMYRVSNVSNPVTRKFVQGVLFLKGHTVIVTAVRLVHACRAAAGFTVTAY